RREWVRSAALPFDSERKRMTTVCRRQDRIVSFTKGAPDVILERCDHYKDETGIHPMTEQRRQKYEKKVSAYSSSGGRVLGAAMKNGNDMSERGMTFLGLAVLEDPVRPEAAEAVREFRRAGVTTVMITGDHKNTALAVAKKLGIADSPAQCVTGEELDRMGDDGLEKRIGSIRVFARVSSDHKVRIVQAFKKADGIVAMTGDGVNDAPSLRAADVGIAMGKNGTDVAKQAADIVLTDDNFATIRNAIEEGREIYENIKKTVIFLLSSNFGEIMTMFFAILFSLPAPLKASHILWINLITDSLPALALGTDVCDGMELMEKEPRRPGESLFAHGGGICTVFYGFLIALISLTAFLVVPTALLVGSGNGSEKSSYFMSYGYLDQDGLVVGDAFKTKRHNARINVNTEVFDRLKINGNVSFVDYYRNASGFSGTGGVFRLAQRMSPLLPVKWQQQNEMGLWEDTEYWSSGSINNPVYVAKEGGEEKRKSRTLNTIVSADLRIIDGLNLGGQYAANYYFRETDKFTPTLPEYFSDGTPDPANKNMRNSVSQAHQDALTQTLQLTLNFQKQINKHEIGALLGYSQEWYNFSSLSASRKKIPFDGIYVIDAGTEDITNSGTKSSWALRSYFGRVNYAFDGKYLVEANMRIDGTSRFARDNRWGYFPSFSAGWNFSREEFMQFAEPVLSSGKLRASWGELGNQNVGSDYYPYLTPIDSGESYPIGGKQNIGFQQSKLGNANIKWETIRMLNVGVDLTFFNNRLTASFDWFKKDNIDALVKPVYPTVVGITGTANLPYENMGKIENKGWELEIGWRDQIGEVKYNLLFNLSDAKNKIVDLGTSEPRLTNNIRREGDPIDAYYGYLTDGLAQIDDFGGVDSNGKYINPKFAIPKAAEAITQPGDIKYRDISGPGGIPDGEIDEYDKVVFGDPYPHYSYSLRGQLQWRDWDFSFYFQGVGKVNGYLSDEARHCFINDYSIPKVEHLDRWTPNNPDATYPRLYQAQSHNLLFSDYWKEDASYLRLKNVQLGYSIPKKLLNRWKIEGLRLYASADNLLTFTKYFGAYDPEVRESSGDVYPQVKTYVFGLVLSF
ncbi:SusC/RagA family TonB-linked outer membrane protein, partial [Barnesiella intestinihominis]|uniref:SusC/RagA family TonB-linked outer membrane protein n=1 Tax=Barnesiella intestinihominis TaxID=487174 RepID=UPI0039677F17